MAMAVKISIVAQQLHNEVYNDNGEWRVNIEITIHCLTVGFGFHTEINIIKLFMDFGGWNAVATRFYQL